MEGITILNSYSDIPVNDGLIAIGFLLLTIGFIVFFLSLIIDEPSMFSSLIILLTGAIFSIISLFIESDNTTLIYEVTVDDTVNFSDFMEKYDILNIEGKIYTIREKEES